MAILFAFSLALSNEPVTGGSSQPLISAPDGRQVITLDGEWRSILDPYDNGYQDYRSQPLKDGYFKNAKPQSPSDLIEYDFDRSPTLKVPADWNSQRESLELYEGILWYKTSFDHLPQPDSRTFLYFGAVNYQANVFLNGQLVGEHVGGFTPFNFEVTDMLRERDNHLIVRVDNKRLREGVPTLNTDWWNYGGITRSVRLVTVPDTFIHSYHVQLAPGSLDRIEGWVQLDGQNRQNQTLRMAIREAEIEVSMTTDSEGRAEFVIDATLSHWSPSDPKRYRVTLSTPTDHIEEEIGFRSIATRGTEILLNGEPIFLRGISLHEEAPWRVGRAHSREDAIRLLDWVQELGANFVRLAHYPHNAFMIDEAERRGLLVWSEIPVYWTIQWENQETWDNAANQLREMIERDRNRAAVVLWSVGNETPVIDERLDFMRRLVELARQLDPTRLITAAMERRYIDDRTLMIDDPLGEYLDVLGCNEYIGWYDGLPAKADDVVWQLAYDKPLIISEFGGGALAGKHGDSLERWSEEYQEDLYRRQIAMLEKLPFLAGMSPWILVDFRSPRRPLPEIQDFWNRKGLVSSAGEKKKAFHILQTFYESLQDPASTP